MTGKDFNSLLDELSARASEAGVAEQQYQKEVARRVAELKEARAFAWRRVNLLRAIAAAVKDAKDAEQATAAGRKCFYREVGWNGATQNQREVCEGFEPVVLAVWTATREENPGDADKVEQAFDEFETWYVETRQSPFLALMERDIVELPLVEV